MFAWFKLLSPKLWLAIALVVATALALGYAYKLGGDAPRAEVHRLVDLNTQRLAAEAAERARLHKEKEKIDAENKRRTAALTAERDGLRGQLVLALAANPAGSKCPEGQVCFDRAELQRADGVFTERLRDLAASCTKVSIDLDSAAESANGN